MKNCTNCTKAIFDPLWGEYKCGVTQLTMYNPGSTSQCNAYVEGTPSKTKEDYSHVYDE